MPKAILRKLEGQRFHNWTVLRVGLGRRKWVCKCICGIEREVNESNLIRGQTKSCGCVKPVQPGHRMTKTSEYRRWKAMLERCRSPRCPQYKWYGERGITVCERWYSFENFYADMGPVPRKGLTIERIDNSKGYFLENVRWATMTEQARNTRRNHLLTFNDKTQSLVEWAEETGLRQETIRRRLKRGWPVEKALTTPL